MMLLVRIVAAEKANRIAVGFGRIAVVRSPVGEEAGFVPDKHQGSDRLGTGAGLVEGGIPAVAGRREVGLDCKIGLQTLSGWRRMC
jgi:hypothetical protein